MIVVEVMAAGSAVVVYGVLKVGRAGVDAGARQAREISGVGDV